MKTIVDSWRIRSLAGTAWPPVPTQRVSQLWTMFLELQRMQWLSAAQIVEGQLAQLRTLLDHCSEQVPYYREVLQRAGIEPKKMRTLDDLRRLPLLDRETLQAHKERMLARQLPPDITPTATARTAGTRELPVEVRQTNLVNMWSVAFQLRDLAWCGIDPRGSLAILRYAEPTNVRALDGMDRSSWNDDFPLLLENGPCHLMAVHQDTARQLDWLERIQPHYLLSYPSNLERLAELLTRSGKKLTRLQILRSVFETLTDEARSRIESAFGVPVRNTYSCTEAGYLASPCPAGHGIHVHGESVLLEVLNDRDEPCAPGETGRVVVTSLHNFLNPLVRYEVLDRATLAPAPCPCGRGLPLLTRVLGKQRPSLTLPGGRQKDAGTLVRWLRGAATYREHQVVQHSADHIIVRLTGTEGWTSDNSAKIVRLVQDYLQQPVRVDVERVERLDLRSMGSFADVVIAG